MMNLVNKILSNFRQSLIYSSKNKIEWQKAQEILKREKIDFKLYIGEEIPLVCCGSKIDIREGFSNKKINKEIYQILVDKNIKDQALNLLKEQGIFL